jgi:hypothetical protein
VVRGVVRWGRVWCTDFVGRCMYILDSFAFVFRAGELCGVSYGFREWRGFKAWCEAVGAVKEGSGGRCRAAGYGSRCLVTLEMT